jgi:hypothetical protein
MRRAVVVTVWLAALGACVRIPPTRVLPNSINTIYVPIFENLSFEPGVEEKLTRLTQEEFLVDGRLDVVARQNADVVLAGSLETFDVNVGRHSVDYFPLVSRITLVADVSLYDPSDRQKKKPLMTWRDINSEYSFISDARRADVRDLGSRGVIEGVAENAYDDALRMLARDIVRTVLTRRPASGIEVKQAAKVAGPAAPKNVLGREKVDTRFADIRSSEPLPVEEPGVKRERPLDQPEELGYPRR